MRPSDRITAPLARYGVEAVCCGILVAALMGILALLVAPGPRAPVQAGSLVHEPAAGSGTAIAESARAFTARPLFHASRTPWTAPEKPAPKPQPTAPLKLVGILGEGQRLFALVSLAPAGLLKRVQAGDEVGPWRILGVSRSAVEVASARGERRRLVLDTKK